MYYVGSPRQKKKKKKKKNLQNKTKQKTNKQTNKQTNWVCKLRVVGKKLYVVCICKFVCKRLPTWLAGLDWLAMQVSILSVAVVEFGTHTPRYWSETFHGVSMEC